jgi:hypothetical protein
MLRWNPHFHAIVLEGGFDDEGTFFFIPFSGLHSMVEVFRHRVITLLVQRKLLNEDFARNLLSWKHSGFSIDNSVRILDQSSQESLAEYIARPPISLKKIRYEPFKGRVLFHTTYSEYFKEEPSHVRRLGLPCRVDATHSTEETPAHPALRALCLPHKGTMGTDAMGCGTSTGRMEDRPSMRWCRR